MPKPPVLTFEERKEQARRAWNIFQDVLDRLSLDCTLRTLEDDGYHYFRSHEVYELEFEPCGPYPKEE